MNLNDMGNGKNFTRFQNFLKVVFVFILFALPIESIAQYDYEHYIPPFYCSSQVGKQEIFLSTNSEKELTVYIEDGQGKSIAGPFTISRTKSETYIFENSVGDTYSYHSNQYYPDNCDYSYGIIGPKDLNKPLDGHGLRIYSYDGPFFANIRHGFSNYGDGGALTHGFSLSAKGATAQGTDFYSGHLYNHTILDGDPLDYWYHKDTRPIRSHSISVMAVEDGETTVSFTGIKCKYITKYEGGKAVLKSVAPTDVITETLSKGQTYTLAVNLYSDEFEDETIEVYNGLNGTHITSSQKIVVNSGSWTAGAKPSQDMGFDQIVPVDQVRDKYIVMKGEGRAEPDPTAYHAGQERTIVVATQANTEVWVNEVNKGTLANPGDFMILDDIVNPSAIPTLYINTKGKDVYVYQTMCGTDENWINIGLNFIPPLTVLGMKEVVIPKAKQITSGDYISPTVTILAQKNVDVEFNGTPLTNPHDVTGTTEWVYFDVSGISGDCRFAGNKAINVAWTASSNTLGAAGYYSGFTKAVSPIHPHIDVDTDLGVICESYDDNIVVSVKEPEPDFYEWYINNFEGDAKFPNSPLDVEAPDVETSYYVIGYYRDPSLDILFNGDFLDGYNGFNSEYELVTKNLTEPGKFAITGRPKDENSILNDFPPLSGWKMFLGYSDNQGDVVYQVDELEVESEFNYIFKMYGRLAQDESANNQSLRVLVNTDTIITDFTINSSNEWQSSSALWSPGDARKASIKILNNNLDSQDAFFAIDSISFVQAVQDTAVFVAKVVPNISTIKDTEYHFCEGTANSLDVSNGDTSWYDYSWSKKEEGSDTYTKLVDTEDIFGVDSCVLTFNDPKQSEEGIYRCTIGFNEDYQRCGPDETLDVDLEVFVDVDANVRISGASHTCMNSPVILQALVEGDQQILKWYVDDADEPVYVSEDKEYSFPATSQGIHKIRCEAENGCGLSSAEVQIEVLAYPELTALNVADYTCVGADVSLEALATVEGTSNLKYYWYKGAESLDHNESTYSFTSSLDDQGDVYSVAVANVYTVGSETFECRSDLTMETDPLNIIPEVNLTPLSDATLCEGEFHEFKAEVGEDESNYEFKWKINKVLTDNKTSAYAISSVSDSDVGAYKVVVWNECFTERSTANLAIKPKIKVYGIDFDAEGPFCTATNVPYTFNVEDNGAAYEYKIIDPNGIETITSQTGTFLVNNTTQGEWQFIVNGECGEDPFAYKQSFWLIPDFGALTIDDVGTCLGENINFYAKVDLDSDLSELTYLWKNSAGTELGSEATLPINNVQESDLGTYTCTVSDGCHEKTESAVLSIEKVNTNPDLAEITLCVGESFEIAIDYVGEPEFEWTFSPLSGPTINLSSTTGSFKISSVSKTDEGIYYCKVKLICGTSVTVKRKLIVNEHINVADVSDLTIDICEGEKPELTIDVTGETDNYSVLWTDGTDTPLDGFGDVNKIQLPAHNTVGSFTYKAIVDGNCEDFEKKYIVQVHEKPILKAVDNDMLKCSGLVELKVTESGEHNGISWWKNGSEITDGNSEPTDFVVNPAISPDDDGTYIAKVSSKYCGPAQASIKLDIINTIELKEQSPALTEVCESNNVTLFVKADGDDIQYKWTHLADPTKTFPNSPSIELKDVTSANDEGEYTCELSNDLGCGNTTATFNVIVNENPSISNPEDQTICETTTSVNFKVKGSAEGDENYQWYKNDVLISGATSKIYTENSPANGSTYYCTVTGTIGDCGTAISNKATLTIINKVSVTDPSDQYIADGADATFSVSASGEKEYTYQWQIWVGPGVDDWLDISDVDKYSGTKTAELKITNADKATYDGKQYRCVVQSSGLVCNSSATSNEATLHINTVVKIASQPKGAEACDGDNVDLTIEGYFDALTYTWQYNDGSGYKPAVGDFGMTSSVSGKVSTLTIPSVNTGMNSWKFKCFVSDGSSATEESLEVLVRVLKDINVSTADASFNPCLNENFSLSVEATGDDIKYQWYKDDVIITGATKAIYNFGNIALVDEATYKCEIYNDEHCKDITRTFIVDVKEPATVDDPKNVVMCETDIDPKFTVTGGGDDISYQWYKNAVAISGATSASYTETDPKDGNTYYCEVSNTCTTVKSKSALLTVVENLETTDPDDLTIADGGNATFTVVASGEPNYTYQWQVWNGSDWDNISDIDKYSGTSTAELTITNADKATYDGKQYRCVVYSDGGICISEVTSGKATLTINTVVKIAADASNAEVCFGDDASLTVTGTSDALVFTWEYDKGSGWTAADGQDGMSANKVGAVSTLTVPGTDLGINTWQFRCLVSDGSSTDVYSNTVTVRVLEDIVVSTIDENFTPCLNDAFALSVETTAGDDIKYQWYKDDVIITGATKAIYNFGNIALADEATYKCEIYNDQHCKDITRTFIVDVKEPATVDDPDNVVMCETDVDPEFTVTGGGDDISYQWYKNNVAISGATSASYTETVPKDGNTYYCEVSNTCETVKTKSALLTVVENLETTDPDDLTIADGADATFNVKASGEPEYSYQWQVWNGSDWDNISDIDKYSGTSTAELTITNADKTTYDGKQYRCVVSSDGRVCISEVTSGKATLTINTVVKIAADASNAEVCFGDDASLTVTGTSDALVFTWEYDKGSGWTAADGQDGMSANKVGAVSTLTVPGTDLGINTWQFRCLVSDGSSTDVYSNTVTVRVLEDIVVSTIDENFTPCLNDAFELSVETTAGDDIKYQWYKDNVIITGATKAIYNFGNIALADEATYKCEIYNDQHCKDITRTFIVDVKEPATVDDPDNVVMCETDVDPEFTVTGGGDDISYQWYKNNVAISGAESASYTETDPKDGNTYYCEVSNTCETVKSKSALLSVVKNLETTDPNNLTIADGGNATFNVKASGEPEYSYQWQVWNGSDWDNISDIDKYSGTSTAELTITNADKATYDGKQYRCVVSSDGGVCISEVTSGIATLTITAVDKILNQPKGNEVCDGSPTEITIEGTVDGHTYIWEYDEGDGSGYKPAVGDYGMTSSETGKISTLSIPNAFLSMNSWLFRCVVNPLVGSSETSQPTTIRVLQNIAASAVLADQSVCENESVTMEVSATGDDILYKWYKDSDPLTILSKSEELSIHNVQPTTNEGAYTCEVYNTLGCGDQTIHFTIDVKELVAVTNPFDKIICETDPAPMFTVSGSGEPGFTYQWYDKNGELTGETSDSYTAVSKENGQSYYCKVVGACNTVNSNVAKLSVVKNLETTDPDNLTIADGANATFTVVASGEPNYTYQWQVWNGSDWDNISDIDKYSGTSTAELTITNADKATYDGKQYRCVVYSDGGICISEVTSGKATLTINTVVKIAADATNAEVCFGDDATLSVIGTSGTLAFAWEYNKGSGWTAADGQDGMSANKAGAVSTLTVPGTDLGINTWQFRCLVSDGSSTDVYSNTVTVRVLEDIVVSTIDENFTPCLNDAFALSVETTAGDDIKYQWYKDNVEIAGATNSTYNFGNIALADEATYKCEVYNDEHCNDITRTFIVDVKVPATVDDPKNVVMCETDIDPKFTVTGGGDNISYQWYKNNVAISGAESASYTETVPKDGNTYYCEVSNTCTTVKSKSALLSVVENLKTTDPDNLTIADGANATFTVVASGEPNYTYQWQVWNGSDWDNISDIDKYSGTSTAELTITNADKATYDGKQYRCIVYSDGGICISEVTSGDATLTINTVVKIAADASNAEVCFGDDATLSVTGTSGTLAFTWEYNKGSGWIAADGQDGMFANKAGAVSTLTVPGTDLGINTWQFKCLVSDGSSTDVYSNTVTVRVLEDIAASAVLADQSVCENESVTMEVTATGDDILYKWYKDSEPLTILSTASSYRIDNAQLTVHEGGYTCEVYNSQGCSLEKVPFIIDVKELVTISNPSDVEMCPSEADPVFKVKVAGDTPYGFQWYNSAGAISGATSDTYTETNPVDGETYYCELSNDCNTINSGTAILTVYEEANYTLQPIGISILDGDDAEFNVEAAGEEPLSYQWQEDSGSGYLDIIDDATYAGSKTASLKITKADLSFNGNKYRCLLSNICTTDLASAEVDLQVLPLYKILTQPANLQACLNDEVSFEIVGTDTDTPYDYEWEYKDASGIWKNAEGVLGMEEVLITNGSQLKISSVSLDMRNWTFHCIVKDGISEDDTSNEVAIEVFEPVSFDLIDNQNLCAEESMQISLSGLKGTTPISYSWMKDATTEVSTTAIVNIGEADNGNYEVTAGNGVCPDFTDKFVVSHYSKLSIEAWSNTSELCIGEEETLTATVNVDPALAAGTSYEWFKDEISLGVTTADYKLTATSKDQSGMYKLVVFDGCNTETVSGYIDIYESITSANVWLSKDTLCEGEELNLEAIVSGDAVSYTWTKDENPITATTNYLVTEVTTKDAGTYKCVVTDHCGIVLTYQIEITILSIPEITDGIEDLPAICEGDALQLGPISINGTYDAISWTLNDDSEDTSSGLSLILGAASTEMEGNYKVAVKNRCGTDASIGTQVVNPIPTLTSIEDQTVCQGEDVIFSAKATGRDVHYHWKIDGVDQATSLSVLLINGMNVLPADEFTQRIYNIECSVTNDNGCGETLVETAQLIVNPTTILKETLKDVVKYVGDDYTMSLEVTGSDLSYEWTHEKSDGTIEVLGVDAPTIEFTNIDLSDAGYYSCIITGTCGTRLASGTLTVKVPVKIVEDLSAFEEKCEGDALRLSIVTSGQVETIKWFKEVGDTRTELTETGSSLYFSELSLDDAATYTCEITGEGIDVIKQSCIVRVYPTTRLNAPIGNQELCEGEMLDWSPDVTGAADLEYVWSFEGNPVSTDKNLHYDALDLLQEGEYQVQVTGLCGDVSSSGNLEITELPEIISVSENAEVCENFALVEFIVKATGENVKYQWRKNGTDMEGKTSPVLSLTSIQLDDAAIYTCRVYNDCAEVISADMKLTVKPQLVILSEPADIEVCSGEDVTFTAEVEGIDVTYQWQVNGVDISGETNSVYTITNTDESHNGYYTCVVSDECTSLRSTKPAKLTVNALPNTAIFGRMVLCAKEDRVTYITNQYGDDVYGWGVEGGIFAGPEEGTKTRVTWSEAANGQLTINITDMNTGCVSRVDSLVVLNALPNPKLGYDDFVTGICKPKFELDTLKGYPEGGIYWVDGISEEVFDPADKGPGNYKVHYSYTDENGCSNITETTNLRVDTLPVVDITDDITVGSCKPFELSAKTDEGNISWSLSDGSPALDLDVTNPMKPIFTPGESQVLVATVVDEHGCKGVDLVEINVAPLPEVTTIADTTVGQCNQLQLSTEIIGDAGEITWTNSDHLDEPDSKDPRIINAPEGTYTYKINVVDLYGCDASDEVTVKMVADPVLEENKFACEGEKFEVDVTGMQNPFWSNSDWNNEERNEINNLDVYTVETPGKYKLEVSNEYGCGAVQNFTINPTPKLDLEHNFIFDGPEDEIERAIDKPLTILEGQTITLAPNLPLEYSPYFFEWQDGSILQRYDVSETGMYKLTVTDNLGCVATDSINIEIKPFGIESPNAFTPNSNDINNNKFYLKRINYDFDKYEMYVYDRWGELLYKTDVPDKEGGWNGYYKGKLCPTGAYVWMVFIDGKLTSKGTFMLLR
nr:immunoglobulin domain-containing protein [uncultured Marinifilum sp.]